MYYLIDQFQRLEASSAFFQLKIMFEDLSMLLHSTVVTENYTWYNTIFIKLKIMQN